MNMAERWEFILNFLKTKDEVLVDELVLLLDSSPATIRRDLNKLHEKGRCIKTWGGAKSVSNAAIDEEQKSGNAHELNNKPKEIIGMKAASLVEENDNIFLDAGSSTLYMIPHLVNKNVTIVTNGILQVRKLAEYKIKAYILGGYIIYGYFDTISGEDVIDKIKTMNFNKVFLGTNGVDLQEGFSSTNLYDSQLKKAIFPRSEKVYVLADSSKFNQKHLSNFAQISEAIIITDIIPDKKYKELDNIIVGY